MKSISKTDFSVERIITALIMMVLISRAYCILAQIWRPQIRGYNYHGPPERHGPNFYSSMIITAEIITALIQIAAAAITAA